MDIRLSLGSATSLGLRRMRMDTPPTTLYTMVGEKCLGACTFCAQARDNQADRKFLSRIIWPPYDIQEVISHLGDNDDIHRICIQTLRDSELLVKLPQVVEQLRVNCNKPISVCMNPVNKEYLHTLKQKGVERVGIGLDCATPETFHRIKPGFSWERYQTFIADTMEIFERGSVHLIVGLGDSDEEMVRAFQRYTDLNCTIGLFALTPVRGTKLTKPAPSIHRYRALQLSRYLINSKKTDMESMEFHNGKIITIHTPISIIEQALTSGIPFRTSGCPDCNRPNYNERPGGLMYNFAEPLTKEQHQQSVNELLQYVRFSSV
jgi:biotin synthase-related radical SAM superfamily protein